MSKEIKEYVENGIRILEGEKKLDILDFKVETKKDDKGKEATYMSGYANTKGKADAYGDIPTNYKGKPVYDVARMETNPVMLLDHENSASRIMGNFVNLKEDDKGLFFKVRLKELDECFVDEVKEAVFNFKSGYAKALSIGGRWLFQNQEKPKQLTKAIIHEISGVGVGADGHALTDAEKIKAMGNADKDKKDLELVDNLKKKYGTKQVDETLTKIKEIRDNE